MLSIFGKELNGAANTLGPREDDEDIESSSGCLVQKPLDRSSIKHKLERHIQNRIELSADAENK
jgi:hypothetical protein